MRIVSLVRFGAVCVALAMTAGAATVGCSNDASTDGASAAVDAAPPDAAKPTDAGRPDSGRVDAGPTASRTILIDVVHASPDTPQVGLCLGGVVGGGLIFPPGVDKVAGPLARYAAMQITVPENLVGAISSNTLRVFAIPGYVAPDAGASACAVLTAPDAGSGALFLKEFPAGTFVVGKGYILAATGCSNAATATIEKCGADGADSTKARGITPWFKEFDRAPQPAGNLGAQFVHLSPQVQSQVHPVPGADADGGTGAGALFGNGVKVAVGTRNPTDAGLAYDWSLWASGPAAFKFGADPTAIVSVPMPLDPNALALGIATAAAGATPTAADIVTSLSLQSVAAATLGPTNAAVSTYFKKGLAYTFFAVGDLAQSSNPQAPNAGPDFFRFLALPNNSPPAAAGGAN